MAHEDLDQLRSVEELANEQANVRSAIRDLDQANTGLPLPEGERDKFATLKERDEEITSRITELKARADYLRSLDDDKHVDKGSDEVLRSIGRPSPREVDIYDLSTIDRSGWGGDKVRGQLRDRAMRAIELSTYGEYDRSAAQEHAAKLVDGYDDQQGSIANYILATGSPTYKRAFVKTLTQQFLTSEEANAYNRALSLTGSAGGFAVPFELDPTIIGTSNGSVNPLRAISRVIPITGDEWRGVSSGAITTAYAAEATETTDNAPTLAQPTISTEKAQAFIPFSIEVGMDWNGLQTEMGRLLQESKDDLEATKFTVGTGTNEPFGLITGATNTVNATAAGVFDLEDLYRLSATLPARYRPRASYMASLDILNKIRQFDTAGGAGIWADSLRVGVPGTLLGRPAYENSAMATVTTVGALFLAVGDFSRFVIVDRIGLSIELIQHLVGTNHRPTGQRGLYAFWRNGSKVVDANAFRVLIGLA
jgi:HK97 family phage major capsid protein